MEILDWVKNFDDLVGIIGPHEFEQFADNAYRFFSDDEFEEFAKNVILQNALERARPFVRTNSIKAIRKWTKNGGRKRLTEILSNISDNEERRLWAVELGVFDYDGSEGIELVFDISERNPLVVKTFYISLSHEAFCEMTENIPLNKNIFSVIFSKEWSLWGRVPAFIIEQFLSNVLKLNRNIPDWNLAYRLTKKLPYGIRAGLASSFHLPCEIGMLMASKDKSLNVAEALTMNKSVCTEARKTAFRKVLSAEMKKRILNANSYITLRDEENAETMLAFLEVVDEFKEKGSKIVLFNLLRGAEESICFQDRRVAEKIFEMKSDLGFEEEAPKKEEEIDFSLLASSLSNKELLDIVTAHLSQKERESVEEKFLQAVKASLKEG